VHPYLSVLHPHSLCFSSLVQKRACFTLILPSTGILQLSSQGSCSFYQYLQSLLHLILDHLDQQFWSNSLMSTTKSPAGGRVLPLLCWLQALCASSFREGVFPLAGPLNGAPCLTLIIGMKTFHYTAFHCCSQLLRYPSSAIICYLSL